MTKNAYFAELYIANNTYDRINDYMNTYMVVYKI